MKFKKPYPDFPLTPHPTGRWCKRVRGHLYYFGPWDDPQGALNRWLEAKDRLMAGGPLHPSQGLRLADLINMFLHYKEQRVYNNRLSATTFADYKRVGELMVKCWGRERLVETLQPADFSKLLRVLEGYSPVVQNRHVTVVRMIFKWSKDTRNCEEVFMGPDFKGPSKRDIRLHRKAQPKKLFTAKQIRSLLNLASEPVRTMILLGINCGLGNTDVATMPPDCWEGGVMTLHRQKTGVGRTIPLWEETEEALDERKAEHYERGIEGPLFRTRWGGRWVVSEMGKKDDALAKRFNKYLIKLQIKQKGIGFYTLRHTFQTVGDNAKDPLATASLMGHVDNSISSYYREGIGIERLRAVTDCVKEWLWDQS